MADEPNKYSRKSEAAKKGWKKLGPTTRERKLVKELAKGKTPTEAVVAALRLRGDLEWRKSDGVASEQGSHLGTGSERKGSNPPEAAHLGEANSRSFGHFHTPVSVAGH